MLATREEQGSRVEAVFVKATGESTVEAKHKTPLVIWGGGEFSTSPGVVGRADSVEFNIGKVDNIVFMTDDTGLGPPPAVEKFCDLVERIGSSNLDIDCKDFHMGDDCKTDASNNIILRKTRGLPTTYLYANGCAASRIAAATPRMWDFAKWAWCLCLRNRKFVPCGISLMTRKRRILEASAWCELTLRFE